MLKSVCANDSGLGVCRLLYKKGEFFVKNTDISIKNV